MSKKISHSAWDKYMTCPKLYDLHYNKRLRPGGTSSALMFGVAMDEALNHLLLTRNLEESVEVFRENFKFQDMAGVTWDERDIDRSIVKWEAGETRDGFAWKCMRVKGRMLLEKYNHVIMPLVEEVYDVQKELHGRPGFIDAIIRLRGYGRVLLDNKTSARPYRDDSIANSTQLALYAQDQGVTKVGFVVLNKQISKNTKRVCNDCNFDGSLVRHKTCPNIVNGKRCHGDWTETHSPEARIQLLVEDLPPINKQLIEESITEVENGIKNEVYPRNLKACGKIYGKPCPYINYCWKGDASGLELAPKTKKEKK